MKLRLSIAIVVAMTILIGCGKKETQASTQLTLTLPTLDGDTIRLESLKGKVVILDFWTTWCPPCRRAIPHLITLYDKYHDRGLEILGISDEDETTLRNFRSSQGIPYPILLGSNEIARQFEVTAIPKTYFIDRKGKVRKIQVGFADEFVPGFEAILDTLLSE